MPCGEAFRKGEAEMRTVLVIDDAARCIVAGGVAKYYPVICADVRDASELERYILPFFDFNQRWYRDVGSYYFYGFLLRLLAA